MRVMIIMMGLLTGSVVLAGADGGRAFRQVCGEKAEAAQTMAVEGREGWLFLANELRHVGAGEFTGEAAQTASQATKPDQRDPLPAILDFKAGLEQAGIELLLVPVPPKAVVYPDRLDEATATAVEGEDQRLDGIHRAFYDQLEAEGVTVLDLYPAFADARDSEGGEPYCRQDSHWSGRGCEIAAQLIAEAVEGREWYSATEKQEYASEVRETELTGDLWNALEGDKPAKETLPLRMVGTQEGGLLMPVEPTRDSPVILLGDSHTLVFQAGEDMHARGAGLADQLALELGFPVDLVGVRGSGATPARINLFRRGRSDPEYFKNKKLVIWCFSAREFTEATSGWRQVPVVKP